jgi:hypothetical protein
MAKTDSSSATIPPCSLAESHREKALIRAPSQLIPELLHCVMNKKLPSTLNFRQKRRKLADILPSEASNNKRGTGRFTPQVLTRTSYSILLGIFSTMIFSLILRFIISIGASLRRRPTILLEISLFI